MSAFQLVKYVRLLARQPLLSAPSSLCVQLAVFHETSLKWETPKEDIRVFISLTSRLSSVLKNSRIYSNILGLWF